MKEEASSTSETVTSSRRSVRPQLLVGGYLIVVIAAAVIATPVSANFFKPFNVTYDHRALVVDGQRRILISAGIHYPRATPEMWPDLIEKSKRGGVDVIQTYVFWNGHEPIRGQYNFDGRYDLVKFVKLVAASGLYLHLRIGPYVCAEWNFGGFPVWLRDVPGIEFRTDNAPFKEEMERFVRKIVDLMREEMLLSWQGGPIILMQDVLSRIQQEETRKQVMVTHKNKEETTESSVFYSSQFRGNPSFRGNNRGRRGGRTNLRGSNLFCENCKKSGHTQDRCWSLYPHLRPQKPAMANFSTVTSNGAPAQEKKPADNTQTELEKLLQQVLLQLNKSSSSQQVNQQAEKSANPPQYDFGHENRENDW